jgi:hypothetical protein
MSPSTDRGRYGSGMSILQGMNQGEIWFRHEHFTRDESRDFLRLAFEIDYNRNGASMLRAMKTALMGYIYCNEHTDENIRKHKASFEKRLKIMRYFLAAATIFVQNRKSEYLLKEIKDLYRLYFGKAGIPILAVSALVVIFSLKEYLRCRISGDTINPKTVCTGYDENKIRHDFVKEKKVIAVIPANILPAVPGQLEQ